MDSILEIRSVAVSFGGVSALDEVSLSVRPGSLLGLIGPNGAGKTTFIDAACGFVPYLGSVLLDGTAVDRLAPHARARAGLVRTFQSVELFDDLDVLGNLLVASDRRTWWRPLADVLRPGRLVTSPSVERAVALAGIGHLVGRTTDQLSEGERKLVGLARALVASPKVLLLDEPAAGLDTDESRGLGARLRAVVDSGITLVLVDHDMDLVRGVCDTLAVLDRGRVLVTGPPQDVCRDPAVVAVYLGAEAA